MCDLSGVFPDDLCCAIWSLGEDVFRQCFCGDTDIAAYWQHHMDHCEWFRKHPASRLPCKAACTFQEYAFIAYTVVLSIESVGCKHTTCFQGLLQHSRINFCRCPSMGMRSVPFHQPWLRYFMTAVYSEHRAVEETFNDLLAALVPRLVRMVSQEHQFFVVKEGLSMDVLIRARGPEVHCIKF